MPRFKASNPVTGEEVYFDWSGSAPPTQEDIKRISDEQRTSRIAAKQKVADADSQRPFMEKLMSSGPAEYLSKAFDVMGLDQPWHPIDSAKQVGAGVSQMVSGQGPEQHPRVAGAVKAVRGVMGMGGPPLTAAGLAVAPIATLGAMTAGNLTSRGVAAVEPDDWSPEVKEAVSTGAGLAVGGLTGHTLSRMGRISPPATSEPKTGELIPFRGSTAPPQEPHTGVNWSYAAPGQRSIEAAPEPAPLPQVMPPGTSIPPEISADEGQVVSPGDPRTTPQKPPIVTAPPQADFKPMSRAPIPSVIPPLRKSIAGDYQSMTASRLGPRTIAPPDTSMFESSLPEEDLQKLEARPPEQDLSSQMRPEPTAPSQVSTVQPARPIVPPIKPPAPPLQAPPQASPVQAPPPLGSSAQGPGAAPAVRPPAGPPPVTQQPQVQAPQDLARAALARAQRPQPPMGPVTPPPAPPPVPMSQRGPQVQPPPAPPVAPAPQPQAAPQVQPPIDLKAALTRGKQPPTVEPDVPQLSPAESFRIAKTNQILEMLKRRKDVTIDQIQRTAGTSGTDTKAILNNLQKRGLISAERGRYNYLAMSREELAPDPTTPEESAAPPSEPASISPHRQQRINDLQQQIGQAEDEGDTMVTEVLRNHLAAEETYAKVEAKGTPEQKARVKNLDDLYSKIKKLEDKEEDSSLTDEETQELSNYYKKANSLESTVRKFLSSEHGGSPLDDPTELKRGFFARLNFLDKYPAASKPRDMSAIKSEFRSQNQALRESSIPAAREIGVRTPLIKDMEDKFVGTYLRRQADAIKGLNNNQLKQVAKLLDTIAPESARGDPKVIKATLDLKDIFDEIHSKFLKEKGVGKISEYFPHIEAKLNNTEGMSGVFRDIWDFHMAPWNRLFQAFRGQPIESMTPGETDLFGQRGVGTANSPFVQRRTDSVDHIDYNLKKVLPAYTESIAKFIYTKPWLEQASKLVAQIPEDAPVAREYAKNYLRYYARYGEYPTIQSAWDTVTGPLMRATARSLLYMDPRLFTLHLARTMSNVYPGVPTKYMAYGVAKTIQNPFKTFGEAGRMGMLPGWRSPWTFQTPMQKLDNIGYGLQIMDFIPDAIGYHGLNKMYRDQGFSQTEASQMAVAKVKELSLRTDPSRAIKMFTRDLGPLKPLTQFKHVVMKIAEQYATMPANAVQRGDYAMVMRFITGAGSMLLLSKKLHLDTWHLDPFHLTSFHAAAYDRLLRIAKKLADGNIGEAAAEAGYLVTPGGQHIKKAVETPSFSEQ